MRFFSPTSFVLLAMCCFLTGCNKSADKTGTNAAAAKADEPKPTEEKSDFPNISADALAQEYAADAQAAADKYKSKAVLVNGTISKKVGDASDRTYIVLQAGDAAIQFELAIIDDYTKFRIKTIKEGDSIAVLGEPDNSGFEAQPMGPNLLTMRFCKIVP